MKTVVDGIHPHGGGNGSRNVDICDLRESSSSPLFDELIDRFDDFHPQLLLLLLHLTWHRQIVQKRLQQLHSIRNFYNKYTKTTTTTSTVRVLSFNLRASTATLQVPRPPHPSTLSLWKQNMNICIETLLRIFIGRLFNWWKSMQQFYSPSSVGVGKLLSDGGRSGSGGNLTKVGYTSVQ